MRGDDDDAARNGGKSANGRQGTLSAYKGLRANGRCRATTCSDREFDVACKSISRPALALSRRRLGVSEVVGRLPEWSQGIVAPCIGAWGGRIIKASQTITEYCRGLGMLSACSSLDGRSAAVSMAIV